MWEPAAGPSIGEVMALLASANRRITELSKEVVYLNGMVWDMYKRMEGHK